MDQGDLRSHTFTWREPPADGARLTGRAYLEALRDGELPPPPMVALLGFRLVEVGDGRVLFSAEPREYFTTASASFTAATQPRCSTLPSAAPR